MHTHTRDNIGDHDRTSAYLRNRSYHLWAGRPIPPVCWLRGHRPELRIVSPRSADVRWGVHCGRCGAVPTLPNHAATKLADGWEPTTEWLDDLDARNGWHYHERIEAGAQVVVPARPRKAFGLRFHLGGLGSETPIDVHAEFAGLAVYANTSVGRRLAHRITGGQGRDLSLSAHSFGNLAGAWSLSWYLWVDRWGDMTGAEMGKLPRWRKGSVSIPTPADLLFGTRKLTRTVVDEVQTLVTITGDDLDLAHMLTLKLERCVIGRERMPVHTHERYWNVDWDVVRGFDPIGTRQEGGRWVRGRVYGSGVRIDHHDATGPGRAWINAASEQINAWARRARAREAGVRG